MSKLLTSKYANTLCAMSDLASRILLKLTMLTYELCILLSVDGDGDKVELLFITVAL